MCNKEQKQKVKDANNQFKKKKKPKMKVKYNQLINNSHQIGESRTFFLSEIFDKFYTNIYFFNLCRNKKSFEHKKAKNKINNTKKIKLKNKTV